MTYYNAATVGVTTRRRLTEAVHDHAVDQIFRVRIRGRARVRADVRFGQASYHQAQIVVGSIRRGHVASGIPVIHAVLL